MLIPTNEDLQIRKRLLKKTGLSYQNVADMIGITERTLVHYFNNNRDVCTLMRTATTICIDKILTSKTYGSNITASDRREIQRMYSGDTKEQPWRDRDEVRTPKPMGEAPLQDPRTWFDNYLLSAQGKAG